MVRGTAPTHVRGQTPSSNFGAFDVGIGTSMYCYYKRNVLISLVVLVHKIRFNLCFALKKSAQKGFPENILAGLDGSP